MRRMHLFEFADFPWLPSVFRDFITDHLRYADQQLKPFNIVAEKLKTSMEALGASEIVDLCSGAGGPIEELQRHLHEQHGFHVSVTLTDKFPNANAIKRLQEGKAQGIVYLQEPVDATDVSHRLKGFRTSFSSIHHFKPSHVKSILRDAVESRTGIGLFESTDRSFSTVTKMVFASLIFSFLNTPKIGKLSFSRFFFTYIIPVAPAIFLWDGCVSVLRSYTVAEFEEMAESVAGSEYAWDVGRVRGSVRTFGEFQVTYVLGLPKTVDREIQSTDDVCGREDHD